MDITEIDGISSDVLVVGDSDIFHLTREDDSDLTKEARALCTALLGSRTNKPIDESNVYNELSKDHTPCKTCLKSIADNKDIELKQCCVCNRSNIMIDSEFDRLQKDYFVNVKKKKYICEKCTELVEE